MDGNIEVLLIPLAAILLIGGFYIYVKSLMRAAKREQWGWFVMMLLVWPLFLAYLLIRPGSD